MAETGHARSSTALLHAGLPIELHMTELAPGEAPHPPHHHVHEEMVILHQGTLEVTIMGHSVKLEPGSVAYVASGEEHGWRNVGTTPAQYYVLALGRDDALLVVMAQFL